VIARLGLLADEYRELEARLADPATAADPARLTEVARRYRALEPVVAALAEHDRLVGDVAAAESLIESADDGERGQLTDEIDIARERLGALALEMRALLIPPDPDAGRAVIMEIRGAEGGEEANLFAGDLLAMYRAYAQRHGWGVEVLDHDESDL